MRSGLLSKKSFSGGRRTIASYYPVNATNVLGTIEKGGEGNAKEAVSSYNSSIKLQKSIREKKKKKKKKKKTKGEDGLEEAVLHGEDPGTIIVLLFVQPEPIFAIPGFFNMRAEEDFTGRPRVLTEEKGN